MLRDIFSNVFFVCGTIVTVIFTVVLIGMVAYTISSKVWRRNDGGGLGGVVWWYLFCDDWVWDCRFA